MFIASKKKKRVRLIPTPLFHVMRKLLTILNAMLKSRTPWRVAARQPA
jgi:hypothetical protein